jgi:hypothetical protein
VGRSINIALPAIIGMFAAIFFEHLDTRLVFIALFFYLSVKVDGLIRDQKEFFEFVKRDLFIELQEIKAMHTNDRDQSRVDSGNDDDFVVYP